MSNSQNIKKLLEYSINNNLRHIPSALSHYSYLSEILPLIDYDNSNFVIGKPFGSQAYYTIWEEMNLVKQPLSYGVKHEEIEFVNFSEETLGNALGVASGIAFNDKKTYVNLSDGALQMGPTLEAIQFIGHNRQNITVFVDCNEMQLTGSTNDILGQDLQYKRKLFENNNWNTFIVDEFNPEGVIDFEGPTAFLFKTVKGQGVKEMEDDPVAWHYKQLKDINEITFN